jgi:hypothetical protein
MNLSDIENDLVEAVKRFNAVSVGIGSRELPLPRGFFERLFKLPTRFHRIYMVSGHFEGSFDSDAVGTALNRISIKHKADIEWNLLRLGYVKYLAAHRTSKR